MQKPKKLTNREMWPLVIIDLNGGVDGAAVMQKYGFLVTKLVLDGATWYKDWRSNHFGMYSCELNDLLLDLESRGFIAFSDHKWEKEIKRKYAVTDLGRKAIANFKASHKDKVKEIKRFLKFHSDEIPLIADAYMRFPEFTEMSKIRRKVQKNILARCKPGVRELVLPFDKKKIDLANVVKKSAEIQYGTYDEEFTEKLAKKIGMKESEYMVPIKGDFSDIIDCKKIADNIGIEGLIDIIECKS